MANLKMKNYPKEIKNKVKEMAGSDYNKNLGLDHQFNWAHSEQGFDFWSEISDGNHKIFYQMCPKEEVDASDCISFDALDDIEVNEPEVISDSIVEKVIDSFKERSNVGIKKYGVTLDRSDLSFLEWLNHLQTELQDAILYAERMKTTDGMSFSYDLEEIESIELEDEKLIIITKN